ncbi:hypothetical protein [Pseudalkalibacillus sp. SCS-8]|uniref:hypothetical protein n=1 Tax=Pseudalkalibacillus nanhaiensis TaxID=3115291 RepID=UPI0032DB1790
MTRVNRNQGVTTVQQWLKQFSSQIDFNTFQNGMREYNEQPIHSFNIFPNHFECVLEDEEKDLQLKGFFQLNDGLPILKSYQIDCPCSDEAAFCKHGVCATMYFILDGLDRSRSAERDKHENNTARDTLIEAPLKRLKANLDSTDLTLLTLHEKRGSRQIKNQPFLKEVDQRIREVLHDIHQRNHK